MDQNSGNGTDKRNWRERLGIGKSAAPSDMPKLSEDFKKTPAPEPAATPVAAASAPARPGTAKPAPHTPVKAAPMAPRPAARPAPAAGTAPAAPGAAKPAAPRVAPVAPDALAAKLKDQREAAERLAVQRVQAAKQRAEAQLHAPAAGGKPKFTFADEGKSEAPAPSAQAPVPTAASAGSAAAPPRPSAAVSPPVSKPSAPPPQSPFTPQPGSAFQPQVQPPRPQLGGAPSYAPSGYQQGGASGYQPQTPYPNQPQYQQPFGSSAYGQPPYRPVDPATGYPAPSGFTPTARPGFTMPPPALGPRLSTPARTPLNGDRGRPQPPRGPQMPMAPGLGPEAEGDDVFEAPAPRGPRRATANEYQQAYRDEIGYDEELPRSRGLGMLLGLVVLGVLTALLAIYGFSYLAKSGKLGSGGSVPVVSAPAGATKVSPDSNAATADQAGKKQIYDRIEGDHEVPGAPMKSNEEAPAPPAGSSSSQPAQSNGTPQPATGGGDGTPLPLPPPPGGGTGQQGALSPDGKTDMASITPAAEPVSAASSSSTEAAAAPSASALPVPGTPPAASAAAASASPAATAPNATATATTLPAAGTPSPTETAAQPAEEQVGGEPAKPAPTPKAAASKAKPDAMKKLVLGNSTPKNLGAKPVVLVPPARIASAETVAPAVQAPATPAPLSTGGGLYGDAPADIKTTAQPPAVANAKPLPAPSLAAGGAYVVQLASFGSKADAQSEYARLSAKHGAIVSRYAPIITAGNVAGTTRYQLNLGPLASSDAASNVCSALISAGERDCKVGRQ